MKQTNNIKDNNSYYMVVAHNSISNIKYIVHEDKKSPNNYSIHWKIYNESDLYPFTTKRLAIAKLVANKVQFKFGKALKDICIAKITPTDNKEDYKEEIVYAMKLNKFGHLAPLN